jgi:hypothetical protein
MTDTLTVAGSHNYSFFVDIYPTDDGLKYELIIYQNQFLDDESRTFNNARDLADYVEFKLDWFTA